MIAPRPTLAYTPPGDRFFPAVFPCRPRPG